MRRSYRGALGLIFPAHTTYLLDLGTCSWDCHTKYAAWDIYRYYGTGALEYSIAVTRFLWGVDASATAATSAVSLGLLPLEAGRRLEECLLYRLNLITSLILVLWKEEIFSWREEFYTHTLWEI